MKEFKPVIITAHIFFLAMFVFAVLYYIERIVYIDTSYYLFKMINFKTFNVEAGRYSAILTQLLPLLAIKLNLSLKFVIIFYSVSFIFIYYLIFLIEVYFFKSYKAGIATTLVMVLGISDSAFFPSTEIQLGVVFCILFYAFLEFYFQNLQSFTKIRKYLLLVLGGLFVLLCLFSHPATLLPLLFILVFVIVHYKVYLNKTSWFFLIFIIAVYLIKLYSIKSASYEGGKIEPLRNFFSLFLHLRSLTSYKFLMKYISFRIYLLPLMLMGFSLLNYLIKSQYNKFLYYGFALAGCFTFLLITHSAGDADIGMEKNLLPLWVLAAVPFVHDYLMDKASVSTTMSVILYIVILVAGGLFFYRAAPTYSRRVDYVRQILKTVSETSGGRKFIIEEKSVNMDVLIGNLSFANETLLISSLEGKDKSKTIYLEEDVKRLQSVFDFRIKDIYLSVPFWLQWSNSMLNRDYFNLPEEPYVFIKYNIPYFARSEH